jgi:biotin carboxyl carrier protein
VKYVVAVGGNRVEIVMDGEGLWVAGERLEARLTEIDGTPVKIITIGDRVHRVVAQRGQSRGQYALWIDGHRYDVEALDERTRAIRDLSGASAQTSGPAPLVAPMPGLIVRVNAQVGDNVQSGQAVVVMEAMKMENDLRTQSSGIVSAVRVKPGDAVEKGAVLVELS